MVTQWGIGLSKQLSELKPVAGGDLWRIRRKTQGLAEPSDLLIPGKPRTAN